SKFQEEEITRYYFDFDLFVDVGKKPVPGSVRNRALTLRPGPARLKKTWPEARPESPILKFCEYNKTSGLWRFSKGAQAEHSKLLTIRCVPSIEMRQAPLAGFHFPIWQH
uniref:Uncharacterized protein n=1 Tax=Romanomermis culicivorax TaxID=13658 RepID=A0A915HLK4_ROMCU